MYFESLHQQIDDRRIDAYARAMGFVSGIGRLSHLTDDVLIDILKKVHIRNGLRVLDLGAGRGFLPRWLSWRGIDIDYVGIDFSESAIAAARRNAPGSRFVQTDFFERPQLGTFDLVFAIEATGDGYVTPGLANVMLEALRPGGIAIATIVTIRAGFDDALADSRSAFEARGGRVVLRDYTAKTEPFVKRLCELVLADPAGPGDLREKSQTESSMFLASIEKGTYGYAVAMATK
ncbi:MAG: methyltransferase domain-containing protein [bacterium]|nr:methyltransferase domain-containing protein [bacterium]